MISVHRLIYNKFSSLDFNLITCLSFDGDNGETNTYLNREAVASENYRGDLRRVHNYKYNEILAPVITFIKEDYEDFTMDEHRKILKWLTSKDTASFLTVYHDDSEVITYEILGAFTEIQTYKLSNGRIVGITATFESVTPWAFSSLHTITKNVSDPADAIITIQLETDDPQTPVYPRITIQQNSDTNIIEINRVLTDKDRWIEGSVFKNINNDKYYWVDSEGVKHISDTDDSGFETTSVSITNAYTDEDNVTYLFDTVVKNNIKEEMITMDGANRVILSSRANDRIFGNDFDWKWIPLYDGENNLSFVGNCIVTIEWREPIKCGDF